MLRSRPSCSARSGSGYRLDASFEAQASGQGGGAGAAPADVRLHVRDIVFASQSPESDGVGTNTVRIGRLDASLGYDAAPPELLDRLLLHEVRASDCSVAVLYPDFKLTTTLDLGLVNETGDVYGQPTRLAVSSDDFLLEAGSMLTKPMTVVVDADVHAERDNQALDLSGSLTAGGLGAALSGLLDTAGLHVTTLFQQQDAPNLVELFVDDKDHHIPVIQDFPGLTGTVERFELALAYTPELGFGLTGAITAEGLKGTSETLMLTVDGISVDTTFSLLPPERGAPLELIVGDPTAKAGPGVITATTVTWNAPGDMDFPAHGPEARLWSEDYVWTLTDILGTMFDGQGTGTIQALADGTVTIDLQFDGVNMAPLFEAIAGPKDGQQQDQMTGHADASVSVLLKDMGKGVGLYSIKGSLRTKPPGGVLRLKEKEKSLNALPGGQQVAGALKQGMSPRVYDHFLEKLKNYQYESITIDASTEGNEYTVAIKLRDADKKNPLPIDLTIHYSRVHIYHDETPPQQEGTQE
jgi:hypothetical protein